MTFDLSSQALLITADNPGDLDSLFQSGPAGLPDRVDLDDLTVKLDWTRKRTLWVVYGSCDADLVDELFKRITPCSSVILLEADQHGAYELAPQVRKRLQSRLAKKRFSIITGGDIEQRTASLTSLIDINEFDNWKPVLSRKLLIEHADDVRVMFRLLTTSINTKMLGKSTSIEISALFVRNALINAPLTFRPQPLAHYRQVAGNRPVLLVSAGPSLNKQIPLLKEHQDLFTIVAVDTVWPILDAQGITPHVIVALDPLSLPSWPQNGLSELTSMVVDIGCAPTLLWSNDKNHVLTSCDSASSACLGFLGGHADHLTTGGSVATSAFNLSHHLGGNPIVLIGQDLALTGGKDHAQGYMYSYDDELLKTRYTTGFDVEGYYGGQVRTERQLLFYKTWFEQRIKDLPDTMVINATEGGARITGALQIPFAQVCAEIKATQLAQVEPMPQHATRPDLSHMARLQANLALLTTRVEGFRLLAEKGEAITRAKTLTSPKERLRKIDKINKELQSFDRFAKQVVDVFGMAKMESIRHSAHVQENLSTLNDAVLKYRDVYEGIQESADLALVVLKRVKTLYEQVVEHDRFDPAFLDAALGQAPSGH